jgi:serine/threonine protein kinase/tetratricopeptide (TPR) repeat protein
MRAHLAEHQPTEQLGHYRILQKIASGGMGEVYLARDEHLDREVAIKVLPGDALKDDVSRARFRNEALVLSKLNHPNIATIHDFDSHGGIDFLVTEYVAGDELSARIARGPLQEKEIIELAMQLVDGLSAAHAQGIVHRDLKPSNLRLSSAGRLKILDFGLAAPIATIGDMPTTDSPLGPETAGTLFYMAPEQLRGENADSRTDIYGVGTVLYEMATGYPPFQRSTIPALINAILNDAPIRPRLLRSQLSPRLEEVILRCVEKSGDHRYQTCADLMADLRRIVITGVGMEKTLLVMYFENLGSPVDGDYFRDGMTEDITTELSKIKDLRVLSRSAVLAYRDKPVTPAFVGQQLHVAYVVEGSVRRDAEQLRITAKLVETKSGHEIWAERYDREFKDVFVVQDEIAKSIADALRLVLTEQEKRAIEKAPTTNVRAYDLYLRGRQFFHQFRRKGYDLAREMFNQAIEIDPSYARAYAGIADCSGFLYMYWDSSEANLLQADAASAKALELDHELAEAHASRGLAAALRKKHDEAHREFEIAISLNPRLFEAYYFQARSFYSQGKLDDAVQWFEQAARVMPEDYQSRMLLASALHGLGRSEEAASAYKRGLQAAEMHLELYPGDSRALYFGANALTQLGDKERAIKWAERALQQEPNEQQVLYNVACVYALLGEKDRAIACLEQASTGGWGQREWMAHDPDLAILRGDPRFEALVKS